MDKTEDESESFISKLSSYFTGDEITLTTKDKDDIVNLIKENKINESQTNADDVGVSLFEDAGDNDDQ